jgi:hypothetical protein
MLKDKFVISCFAALCILYAIFHFSPSSYGIVLNQIQLPNTGLFIGSPQAIRGDEHSVVTPTFQICVNNHFERYNTTSPYGEDLRTNLSFPLKDWGLIFKPYFAFFLLNPAIGYSAYWAFFYFLFFAGYYLLFRSFKLSEILSICGSLGIFSTSFVQCWWTSFGPHLAVIPWIYLSLKIKYNYIAKFVFCSYTLGCWLILFFYPGFIVIHSILIVILLYSTLKDSGEFVKNITIFILGAVVAGGIAVIYLYDWIKLISATDLGARSFSGGQVDWIRMLSHIYPKLVYVGYDSLWTKFFSDFGRNTCEVSTAGSLLFIAAFIFAWDGIVIAIKKYYVLLIIIGMIFCWMLFPIPNTLGKILLLDKVPGGRLTFLIGLPAFILFLSAFQYTSNRITLNRIIFTYIFLISGYLFKFIFFEIDFSEYQNEGWISIAVILLLCLIYVLDKKYAFFSKNSVNFVVLIFSISSSLFFIGFNPMQSTKNIFIKPHNTITANFDLLQSVHPRGWLVVPGFHGSILNGIGYKSITHTLYSPQPEFFQKYKSSMSFDAYNAIFNRWGYIHVTNDITIPCKDGDLHIIVPQKDFLQ